MLLVGILSAVLTFGHPVLPPMQWAKFAVQADKIETASRPGRVGALKDLETVNARVNQSIVAVPGEPPKRGWQIWPSSGWCGDFALTKRHELIKRGWPSHALLIAVAGLDNGAAHAVLLVHVKGDWYALDNLTPEIKPAAQLSYRPISTQEPGNPSRWRALKEWPR